MLYSILLVWFINQEVYYVVKIESLVRLRVALDCLYCYYLKYTNIPYVLKYVLTLSLNNCCFCFHAISLTRF